MILGYLRNCCTDRRKDDTSLYLLHLYTITQEDVGKRAILCYLDGYIITPLPEEHNTFWKKLKRLFNVTN